MSRNKFSRTFFLNATTKVARELLGSVLTTNVNGKRTSGRIVEVEAYLQQGDAASHSYRGETPRNYPMFGQAGHCYVYKCYGIHHCVNVVTERKGTGCAVLIRALEPLEGIELMTQRRGAISPARLASGPGNVCKALGIDMSMQGEDLLASASIALTPWPFRDHLPVSTSPRIGISKSTDLPWRFYVTSHPAVTRRPIFARPAGRERQYTAPRGLPS